MQSPLISTINHQKAILPFLVDSPILMVNQQNQTLNPLREVVDLMLTVCLRVNLRPNPPREQLASM